MNEDKPLVCPSDSEEKQVPEKSTEQNNKTQEKKSNFGGVFIEITEFLLIAFVLVFGIRFFVAQPFIVSGTSMVPTFENSEYLIIDELSYRFTEPERGDVIVFRYPEDESKFFIKRIIGLPNETIIINDSVVRVKSDLSDSGFILNEPYVRGNTFKNLSRTLGANEYFVMGDNREASSDSRSWGPVSRDEIIGRAFVRLFPVAHASILPGEFNFEK